MSDSGIIYTKKEHVDKVIDTFFRLLGDLKSNTDKSSIDISSVRIPVDNGSGNILHTTETPSISSSELLEFISENLDLSIVEGKIIANLPSGSPGPPGPPGAPGSSADVSYKEVISDIERDNLVPDYKGQILKQLRGGSFYISNSTTKGDWSWFSFGKYVFPQILQWENGKTYKKYDLVKLSPSDSVWESVSDHASAESNKPLSAGSKWIEWSVEHYHWSWERRLGEKSNRVIEIGQGGLLGSWSSIFNSSLKRLPQIGGGQGSEIPEGFRVGGSLKLTGGIYRVDEPVKLIPLCGIHGNKSRFQTDPYIAPTNNFSLSNKYVVYGYTRSSDGNAHSAFNTYLNNVFIDGKRPDGSRVERGVRLALSQGSRVNDIEVDRVSKVGYHIVGTSDDWSMERCLISSLIDHNVVDYGMWFDKTLGGNMENIVLARCAIAGLCFGNTQALSIDGYETENVELPILFRTKNHVNINGSPADDSGEPAGVVINGIKSRRPSVSATRALARVRYTGKESSLTLVGFVEGANSSIPPYDRVEVQLNNGPIGFYPLDWKVGFNRTDNNANKISFNFDLRKMIENYRFHSDNIKMDSFGVTVLAKNSPGIITGNTSPPIPITLQPGLYRILIRSTNTYAGGNVTIYQSTKLDGGLPIPDMKNYSGSGIERYWHHPGGNMEVEVSGVSGTSSIDVLFIPWLF
jgi:hypothetical protein